MIVATTFASLVYTLRDTERGTRVMGPHCQLNMGFGVREYGP